MSNLTEYVERVKRHILLKGNMSEAEIIRYVYLDLGKRFSFNSEFFIRGRKIKEKIYRNSKKMEHLNESMETNSIICKSVSYILEYILKKLGVNIRTVVDPNDKRNCPHMYNIVTPKEGEEYIIDLQEDIRNIQSHSFTRSFGLSIKTWAPPVIKRCDIEKMDRKLGYIDDKNYYSDDYIYLLKSYMGYFTDFSEKVQFVLENIEIYLDENMKYSDRYWRHKEILEELFSKEELKKKIHQIDCYQDTSKGRIYKNCIVVQRSRGIDVYMYSIKEKRYCKMSMQDFAKEVQNGLIHLQGVIGLKEALKKLREDDKGR